MPDRSRQERVHLTQAFVADTTAPASGQAFHRDDALRGLALRVTAAGARTFVWEGWIKGRSRRVTLGRFPDMPVVLARKRALEVSAAFARGEDPAAERIEERREATFGDLADAYIERHAKPHKRSWKSDEQMLATYLKSWRTRRLSTIRREDVAQLHDRLGRENGRYTANRVVALVRTMFALAADWGYLRGGENPATRIKLFEEEKRDRFLSDDELRRVNDALLEETDWRWRAYFPLALLLGTRRTELLSARWADVDLTVGAGTLRIPITKAGRPHSLPLPSSAIAILEALPSLGTSEWLFPGTGASGHAAEPGVAWRRIRERAGVPDVRLHDLRRTLGSRLAASGYSLPLIGKVLGHSQPSTTAVYARLSHGPVRAALEENAAAMQRTIAGDGK